MMVKRADISGILIALTVLSTLGAAQAETIREDVKKHVEESLAKEKEKANQKAKSEKKAAEEKKRTEKTPIEAKPVHPSTGPKPSTGKDKPVAGSGGKSADGKQVRLTADASAPKPTPRGPKLPLRVIHENFKLDLREDNGTVLIF